MNRLIILTGCALGFAALAQAAQEPHRLGERNPLVPPFVEVFDDYPSGTAQEEFERRFQTINADGDLNPLSGTPRTWGYYNFNGESGGRQFSKCAYLQHPLNVTFCDDWLISRAIKLEAGKYYHFSLDASLYADFGSHAVEVKIGEYNDAEGMEFTIVPVTQVTSIRAQQLDGWFKPEFDDTYYIGIHGVSGRSASNGNYLFVDNIAMEAPRTGREPAQVTDIQFVLDPNGSPAATISFKAPAVGVDGLPISGNVNIVVKRDGTQIKSFTANPGQSLQLDDVTGKAGYYDYTFTASNAAGDGCDLRINRFIGMGAPMPPMLTSISETENHCVRITWEAPETDVNGTPINPEALRYNIYESLSAGYEIYEYEFNGTEIVVDKMLDDGEQAIVTMAVAAVINGNESQYCLSDFVFIGDPYKLPFENHFTYTGQEYVIGAYGDEGILWRVLDDFSDPQSQDGDNSYICMVGTQPDQKGQLTTGKIDFTDSENPCVSFYTYIYDEDDNEISVSYVDCATGEETVAATFVLSDFENIGWTRVLCPLRGVQGKIARVVIGARIETHGYIPLDNMRISEMAAVDMGVVSVWYDKYASLDEPYTVIAKITNFGAENIDSYQVRLLCEGEVLDTVDGEPLESFASTNIELSGRFSVISPEMPTFTVEVLADGDTMPENNVSKPFNIAFVAPCHPVVTNLQGSENGTEVVLTWNAPDLSSAAPEESIEDFESYPSFTNVLNEFTMVDADGGNIAGFTSVDMPVKGTPQAYFTISSMDYGFLNTCGTSSLFTMATMNEGRRPIHNDDWLISPELYGGRQTIGFKACSQSVDYGYETFEVYASSASNKLEDFEKVMMETAVGELWEQFYVTLPAGTRYFAIRCTSNDCLLFTLDDITYSATGDPQPLQLLGYNVYRNGVQLNATPVTTTTFTTTRELTGDDYFVTAVYDKGESTSSNIVRLGFAGIDTISADIKAEYYDLRGLRVNPDKLSPGLYIVRRGTHVSKVIIK